MPEIKVQHVLSCSSEDLTHKADNILKPETYRKWKGSTPGERQISIVLQLEKASLIHAIDVGNEGSAFIEILVGSSSNPLDYQVILVSSSFMSPPESKSGTNTNRVRMFGPDKLTKMVLNKRWDRVKIVCSQPFNKHNTYGLSFIKFHSPPEPGEEASPPKAEGTSKLGHFRLKEESQSSSLTPGNYFKKRDEVKEAPPLTGAAAVRAASTLASASMTTATSQAKQARRSPSPAKTKQPTQKRRLSEESSERQERGRGRSEEREKPAKQPQLKKRKSEASEAPKQSVPFKKLMEGVTFVLSGFQNPLRGDIRDKAIEMGAKYKPDWAPGCTHLICAFASTPKYNQVKGKGKIVRKQWILDSHRKKMLMPWKRYILSSGESSNEDESYSEEEEEEEEWESPVKKRTPAKKSPTRQEAKGSPAGGKGKQGSPSKGKSPMKKSTAKSAADDYGSSTEEESDGENVKIAKARRKHTGDDISSGGDTEDELRRIQGKPAKDDDEYSGSTDEEPDQNGGNKNQNNGGIPELPDFFSGKNFFMYGKFDKEENRQVKRFIIAFGGLLQDYMKDDVQYVITNSAWDDNFDEALTDNASLAFVKPKWLYRCNEKAKMIPYQPYVIIPK